MEYSVSGVHNDLKADAFARLQILNPEDGQAIVTILDSLVSTGKLPVS